MKKFILFFLFLSFSSQISLAEIKDNKFNKQLQKIEKETQACLDNSDGGLDMAKCEQIALDKYEIIIENLINKLMQILPKNQKEQIISSQNAWIEYVKKEFNLLDKTINHCPPYDAYLTYQWIKKCTYKTRAENLEKLYGIYSFLKDEKIVK